MFQYHLLQRPRTGDSRARVGAASSSSARGKHTERLLHCGADALPPPPIGTQGHYPGDAAALSGEKLRSPVGVPPHSTGSGGGLVRVRVGVVPPLHDVWSSMSPPSPSPLLSAGHGSAQSRGLMGARSPASLTPQASPLVIGSQPCEASKGPRWHPVEGLGRSGLGSAASQRGAFAYW